MRFVHTIDGECQCCGSLNGSRGEITIVCHDEPVSEVIEIEGDPKYIKKALEGALDCLNGLLETRAAQPPPREEE